MFGIGHLLKKTKNHQTREYFVRDVVRLAIKDIVGVDILIENIQIKEVTITMVNVNQSLKSEIYIKKQQLLKLINEKQNIIIVSNIR
jgi:hypothetical protein